MFAKLMQNRAIQATFNFKNYTRNFGHEAIQTLNSSNPTYKQYSFVLATASALSISVYCNQRNQTNTVAAAHTNQLALTPVTTISSTNAVKPSYISDDEKYTSWTEKEIMEQPQAISKALQFGTVFSYKNGHQKIHLQPLSENRASLQQIKDLIITGAGPSMNAAMYAKRLMEYIDSFETVQIVDSTAPDTIQTHNTDTMGILSVGNDMHKIADSLGINPLNIVSANEEETFMSSATVLTLICAWFSQLNKDNIKGECIIDALHKLHTYSGGVIRRNQQKCIEIGQCLKGEQNISVFGRGFGESIAYEGCDKLREITGMNASVNESGENCVKVCIVLEDEYSGAMIEQCKQCAKSGGEMVYITDNMQLLEGLEVGSERVIEIPHNGPLTALLAVVPLQLMAYYIAMAKGVNPDQSN